MSLFAKTILFAKSVGRQFESVVSDLSKALGLLIEWPYRDLRLALKRTPKSEGEQPRKRNWAKIAFWPVTVVLAAVSVLFRILMSPAELLIGVAQRKSNRILWTLPAFLMFLALAGMAYRGWLNSDVRLGPTRRAAVSAMQVQDLQTADLRYAELNAMSPEPRPQDLLNWALVLVQLERSEDAMAILNKLAPGRDGDHGYPPAHRWFATLIASRMGPTVDPVTLKALRWHLDGGGDSNSPEYNRVWAEYFLRVGDDDNALRYMKLAATARPEFMVMVAEIYRKMGNPFAQRKAMEQSRVIFKNLVKEDPKHLENRILYSKVLFALGDVDATEKVLLDGERIDPSEKIRAACAEFYLSKYLHANASDAFSERFSFLQESLKHDLNHVPAYQELIRLYRRIGSNAEGNNPEEKRIMKMLRDTVTADESAALAHFALSNILWVENNVEQSRIHMERAFELDQRFSVVANNLAWLLAHSEDPDLDRAFEVASQVVQRNPNNGRYRDTLANVLMKQEEWDLALAEFQRALPTMPNKKSVHENMALIYRTIGRDDLADQHEKRAKE